MRKGINQWAFPEDLSPEDYLKLAKEASFDGVEFNVTEEGELSLKSSDRKLKELCDAAEGLGLQLPSLCMEIPYRLTSNEEEERAKAQDAIRSSLRVAHALGASALLIVSGGVDFSIWTGTQDVVPYDAAYERTVEGLRAISPDAEELGVCIGLENVWDKFLLSPLEFKRLIDEIDSPYVQVYFDVANVLISGYPEQWIRILGERIRKVHVKDFKLSVGNINGFCNLLEGDVNWPAVMRSLREVGYDDYLVAEVMPPYKFHPDRLIHETSKSIDAIMEDTD